LRRLMFTAMLSGRPFVIRYPRGKGPGVGIDAPFEELPVGRAELLRDGEQVAVLTLGHVAGFAAEALDRAAAEGIHAAHIDLIYAKPLDEEMLHSVARRFRRIITVEDGAIHGGVGSAVAEFLAAHKYTTQLDMLGIPDKFIEHGTLAELHRLCGYDAEGIYRAITG